MAERKLNFNAPLLSTRRMQKTAVSVRRNKLTDHSSVSVLVSETGLDQVTEAVSVPFTWEQAPGRLKGNEVCDSTQEVFTPCLPPGKAIDGNLTVLQSLKVEESENDNDDDDDDVFSDARDTLSPFSINHSISGVSGYGVVTLSEDRQSRDFMLNRFLPAAKAMTLEQSLYASNRKPSTFMPEPTIQIRGLVPEEKRQTPNSYDEFNHQDIDIDDEESPEDDEVSEYTYLSKRGCGMLCFKDSLNMLKQSPITSSSYDQVKTSKVAQLKSRLQSVKKLALDSVSKHKLGSNIQSPVHPSVGKLFKSESNLTVASRSSSPYRNSRSMSPFRSTSNTSPFHPDTRKETENLRANRLNKHIRNISNSQELLYLKRNGSSSSLMEKTVYVETDKPLTQPLDSVELEASEKINNGPPHRSLLAPPSPKKPSESWLLHNLPSVTSQIPSRRYVFNPQKQDLSENSKNVTKWETIVKTSYMHRDHIRYSEELVAHTSHQ